MEKVASLSLKKILQDFPRSTKFCFAYGSGAFKQSKGDPMKNMLDLVFVVRNSRYWHAENIARNPHHYALPLRYLGQNIISKVQETWGAKIYYNTLIKSSDNRLIKYGVISEQDLVEDLLDWNMLYLAGRLHKPVHVVIEPDENSPIPMALNQNLKSAVHAALLLLPENFTEIDFFKVIAGISYHGDFRMTFGEDKSKVDNIVMPQVENFRELYAPILKSFDTFVDIPKHHVLMMRCHQDDSPAAKIHHLNQLPRTPQVTLVRKWSHGPRSKDMEDCLRAIAHDPDCSEILQQVLCDIVWRSSVTQSLKGIITAGLVKSIKYSSAKIIKMMKSNDGQTKQQQLPKLPEPKNIIPKIVTAVEKNTEVEKPTDIKESDDKRLVRSMTTMDSDSESQDSDEGRRFRFEATRKIASDGIHDKRHKAPPSFRSYDYDRRSRSRDRSSRRERRDERTSNERMRKEGTSSRDDARSSKDRKSLLRDEPRRRDDEFTRHRDTKNIHKDSRDFLLRHDSRSRDRRESKSRDEKPPPPRRRSREKSYDKLRHDFKCRDRREKHYSRDRTCQPEKTRDDNYPTIVDKKEKIEVAADGQDCKDLNLSDFDIVSDTDGDSDTSDGRNELLDSKSHRRICNTRMNTLDGGEEKVKNRRNGNKSPGPSNSNNHAHALSDFLLGNASTSAPTTCSYNNSDNEKKHKKKNCTKLKDDVTNNDGDGNINVKNKRQIDIDISEGENSDESSYGPALPPSLKETSPKKIDEESNQPRIIGPSLPSEHRRLIAQDVNDDNSDNKEDEEDTFGPALPPHLRSTKSEDVKIVGPSLPEKLEHTDHYKIDIDNIINYEDGSDNEDFEAMGPLPLDHPGIENDRIQQQLEYRARLIKEELAQIDNCEDTKREEWMTELPAVQTANLGLAPRKFRSRPGPDMSDRSGWTDTPVDRARKHREQQMGKRPRESEHEIEVRVEKSRVRHEKSLLELHQKKMNKKKKKEEKAAKEIGKPVRRPFDRDVDLKANHFDEARKKRIMMKATSLDDRFSRGKI